jgi:TonB family protein
MRCRIAAASLLLLLLTASTAPSQTAAPSPPPTATPGAESVVVQVCVDAKGNLTAEPTVVTSSGQQQLDDDAIKVAKSGSGKYIPPSAGGGCIKFRVKFH